MADFTRATFRGTKVTYTPIIFIFSDLIEHEFLGILAFDSVIYGKVSYYRGGSSVFEAYMSPHTFAELVIAQSLRGEVLK